MYSEPYILRVMSSGYRPERVKALRARLGMTQKQLADAAGTSQGDISRIERGETGVTADDAKRGRIARALGTTVEDIYDGVGASAVGELTVHKDDVDVAPADAHAIFDAALLRAVGEGEYTMGDFEAVRATSRETAQHLEGSDPLEMVRAWLRAARYFRLRGVSPSPTMIAARSLIGHSQQTERADAETTQRTREEAAGLAESLGLQAEGPSPKVAEARRRATETATGRRSE